jgi:hypothetical protein
MSLKINDLKLRYPNLFRDNAPLLGMSVGEGWFDLLDATCNLIEEEIKRLPEDIRDNVYAEQIKEKFGTLRFYMTEETPYIKGVIALAEEMSYGICEVCGNKGEQTKGGWVKTLCKDHIKK